jgi:hypothetical protein
VRLLTLEPDGDCMTVCVARSWPAAGAGLNPAAR